MEAYATDELMYSASAYRLEYDDHTLTRSRWTVTDSLGHAWGDEYEYDSRLSTANGGITFSGWSVRGMSRLPRVEIEEESGGSLLLSAAYEVEPQSSWDGWTCGQGWDGATGVFLNVCTGSGAYSGTNVYYNRWSTRVTYHSSNYIRIWDDRTGEEQVYHYNYDSVDESGPPLQPWGSDFTLRVRLVDGDTQFWAAPTFPLQTSEYAYQFPLVCWIDSYWWSRATSEYCSQSEVSSRSTIGDAANWP